MADEAISATTIIHAPAEAVFAVLADPTWATRWRISPTWLPPDCAAKGLNGGREGACRGGGIPGRIHRGC